ncbi:hypothetical protein P8452_07585 [Trifolium repens]|nr:hypothetical protein P8452_07585 [Trifolium repens]
MQAAKKAVENMKETAANIGASAKSGMEKTKATVQEKTEKMRASDPIQKEMATEKKEERIHQAETEKQEAREHNAAAKHFTNVEHVTDQSHHNAKTASGCSATTLSANADHTDQSHHNAEIASGHSATKLSANADHVTDQSHHNTDAASRYSAIGDYGSGQPMATDHVSAIPTLGFGKEVANEVAMGSHPIDTNTKAHNVHLAETRETQPGSAPAKY